MDRVARTAGVPLLRNDADADRADCSASLRRGAVVDR